MPAHMPDRSCTSLLWFTTDVLYDSAVNTCSATDEQAHAPNTYSDLFMTRTQPNVQQQGD